MSKFIIKLDSLYFAGEGEEIHRSIGSDGWYVYPTEKSIIALTSNYKDAKIVEEWINVHSFWNRIYEAIRYREIKRPSHVQFIEVGDEK